MKKIIIFLFVLIFCYPVFCSGAEKEKIEIPNYEIDEEVWDFGEVKSGSIQKHTFTLKNETGIIMRIQNVATSCGCTISEIKDKTLLPGESTELDVRFNTEGYLGEVSQFVYVTTDNIKKTVFRFTIKAKIIQ